VSDLDSLAGLIGMPVRHRGITLGRVRDLLVDDRDRPLGLEVLSVADESAFLPWPSHELGQGEVIVPTPLSILSEHELEYYRRIGRSVRVLLGLAAETSDASMVAGG
jgi:hypothetical protein